MKKLEKNEKGITLMALVVTIIILLILAAVTVRLTLDDKGVISEAREAVNEWDKVSSDEEGQLSKLASDMRKLRNRTTGENTGEGGEVSGGDTGKSITEITGNELDNTETKDKNGNKIVIPAGFKPLNPEDDVTKGIVIEDESAGDETSKGNQYVWIPVSHVNGEKINTIKDSSGVEHTIELARYTFDIGTLNSSTKTYNGTGKILTKITDGSEVDTYYKEETEENKTSSSYSRAIAEDIEAFKSSVSANGGYYIARYEAGDPNTSSRTTNSSQAIIPVFRDNQIVYNYITQLNASTLARGLYDNQQMNYISDLINSYAWDTTIVYMQEFSGDRDYSKEVGMGSAFSINKTGKIEDSEGNKDVRCNIYDMSSNLFEWSTETNTHYSTRCTLRGGRSGCYYTAFRTGNGTDSLKHNLYGFRRYFIHFINIIKNSKWAILAIFFSFCPF